MHQQYACLLLIFLGTTDHEEDEPDMGEEVGLYDHYTCVTTIAHYCSAIHVMASFTSIP